MYLLDTALPIWPTTYAIHVGGVVGAFGSIEGAVNAVFKAFRKPFNALYDAKPICSITAASLCSCVIIVFALVWSFRPKDFA